MKKVLTYQFLFHLLFLSLIFIPAILIQGSNLKNITFCILSSQCFLYFILKERKIIVPTLVTYLLGGFIVWLIICTFFSADIYSSIWEILKYCSLLLFFIVIYNLIKKSEKARNILIACFVVISLGILIFDLINFIKNGGLQFIGVWGWHNQSAGFLLFLTPLLFVLLFTVKNNLLKLILFICNITALFVMVVTYSRGGWLSLLAAFMFFIFLNIKRIRTHFLPLLLSVLIIFTFGLFLTVKPITNSEYAPSLLKEAQMSSRSESGNFRVSQYVNTLKMIKDYPIFGVGPNGYGLAYTQYQTDPWLYSNSVHNYYLKVGAETGIPGLIIFLSIIFISAFVLFKQKDKLTIEKNPLLIGITMSLIASLVHSLIDIDWYNITLLSFFWFFVAVFWTYISSREKIIKIKGINKLIYLFPLLIMVISTTLLISELKYQLAAEYFQNQEYNLAEDQIKQALIYCPYSGPNYQLLGLIKLNKNELDKSREAFLKAIKFSKFDTESKYRLALIAYKNNNYAEATKLLEEVFKKNPYYGPERYKLLVEIYSKTNNLKEAENFLQNTINNVFPLNKAFTGFEFIYDQVGLKKQLAELYFILTDIYLFQGKNNEAQKLLEVVEKRLDPQNPWIATFSAKIKKI